jgi:transmembrane sensor
MTKSFEELPEHINEQASEWFALMQSGNATTEDQRLFGTWLSIDLEHRRAYDQLESIWHSLGEQSSNSEVMALRQSVQSNWIMARFKWIIISVLLGLQNTFSLFARRPLNFGTAVAFLLVAVVVVSIQQPTAPAVNYFATSTGQIQTLTLADGSEITLGAKSKVKITMDKLGRGAELLQGEAFFDIASDKIRPFVVLVDKVAIEVVGTQFNVLKRTNSVNVSVLEGRVNVSNHNAQNYRKKSYNPLSLTAGQQVVKAESSNFGQVETVDIAELAAWRSGRLIFTETALIDVIDDASRYFDGKFSMQSKELADQKVTVSLRTDQINQLPQMLAQVLPIEYRKIPGNIVVLESAALR